VYFYTLAPFILLQTYSAMRFRLFTLLLLIFISAFSQFTFAQEVVVKRSSVVETFKGKPYYMHFVTQGETLTAIAKAYDITVEELNAENPSLDKGLKADMVLRIPQKSAISTPKVEVSNTVPPTVQPKPAEKLKEQAKPAEKPKEQGKSAKDPDFITYQVKKQETLYGISKQHNVSVDDIVKANPGIQSLNEGMEIKIPKKKSTEKTIINETSADKDGNKETNPDEIIVKQGETLYSISKAHHVTVDELIDLNPTLSEGLKAGMVLKLHKADTSSVKPILKTENAVAVKPVSVGHYYNTDNIKATYKIALLLPLLLDESTDALEAPEQKKPSDFESFNYFQFYAGFMLAADSLEQFGLHARIQVMDADKLNDSLKIKQVLRKPGMDKMDLLVGPMYVNSFSVAARFARKHEIGIINPLSRRENIVDGNPYVIKTQVSASGIATKLSSFISKHYPNANIISVRNDAKELKPLADNFESQIRSGIASHSFKGSLQLSTYSTDMMAGVSKKLKSNAKNIIIFFSNNKSNVPNFVSLLNPLAKSNDIILMGMDGWDELELETEFLVNLNYHQVTSSYIDYESEAVQQFITRFRNRYGAVPLASKHAFLGYDIGWYFLTSLMWYGENYLLCLPDQKGNGLQFDFNFSGTGKSDGLQNQDVTIVKLQDYKMIKVE
jgi:LysM repeat protein/ABC-type branched-subunit amino acid transport system substrate-binding protein